MANGKQLSQKGVEEILDIIDSYIDIKEAVIEKEADMKEKFNKTKPTAMCTDLCEHCVYLECGDFLCTLDGDCTIEDWTPKACVSPKGPKVEADNDR